MAYFDNNSTTKPLADVLVAMQDASAKNWANPSSPHRSGGHVRALIERAREEIAQTLDVEPKQLTFTSGATESNNAVISSIAKRQDGSSNNILLSSIEHPSVLETAKFHFSEKIRTFPVNSDGVVQIEDLIELIDQKVPHLVALMAVHNETGVVQPWQEVAQVCRDRGVWFHCDATQWIGKLDPAGLSSCSSFSFSAHKFGGPKGVGALVSNKPISWVKGGGQERETRGGTENFPGIEGMRVAWLHHCCSGYSFDLEESWRDAFEEQINYQFTGLKIIGRKAKRLWNTSLLCLPEFNNLDWVSRLDKLGHVVSTGSACSTARDQPSTLSGAIGLNRAESRRLVRVSASTATSKGDWQSLGDAFQKAYIGLQTERKNDGVISL